MKPFLCCDADINKIQFPVLVLPKIDGVRILNVNGKATGRSLKSYKNKLLTETFSVPEFSGLDGELAVGNITSPSLCRDTTSMVNTINSHIQGLKWYLFDLSNRPDLDYFNRHRVLCNLVEDLPPHLQSLVDVIPYRLVNSKQELSNMYEEYVEQGYEGVVIRSIQGKYKHGRGTVNEGSYLRMKPQSDKDAIILDVSEALANNNEAKINELGHTERSSHKENKTGKGMIGSLLCRDLDTGSVITVGAGKMTHEERIYWYNHQDEIIGKMIKYKSMDTGVKDAPRFPRFIGFRAEEDR